MVMKTMPLGVQVLITGMGPYPDGRGGHIDSNTSFTITKLLPHTLEANSAQNPLPEPICIRTLGHPVKSEYRQARDFCRDLHTPGKFQADLIIHLGEARGWDFMTVERAAYKQGMSSMWWSKAEQNEYYTMKDDEGLTIHDLGPCPWDGIPIGLCPNMNVDLVVEGAQRVLATNSHFQNPTTGAQTTDSQHGRDIKSLRSPIEVKPHSEAGPFLCGFLFYESMANGFEKKSDRTVLFCHIPGEADEENLSRTLQGVLAVVVAASREILAKRG